MDQVAAPSTDAGPASPPSQYLTFRVGPEQYGVPILAVHEIKGQSPITPLPNSPPHVAGVINLRGTIVPVVDLRAKFGLPEAAAGPFTVIVLVTVGTRIVGMVVDAVDDVLSLPDTEVQSVPDLGAPAQGGFVSGLGRAGDRLIVLLDVARLLDGDDRLAPARAE